MEKSKFTTETTAHQKLDSLKHALKASFAEPSDVQRRRLATKFSTMKQRATESIDQFAFRFKKNLHRLAKLREPVESTSPQFIMSQCVSKMKTDIQKRLVLKAEECKDLSEIIEAAKRIDPPSARTATVSSTSPRSHRRGLRYHHSNSQGHVKNHCPDKTPLKHCQTTVTKLSRFVILQ